jgi:hypothetical protein
MTDAWTVRPGTADDPDSLAPLWIAVHHQQVASMPELAPYVGDDETWRECRGYRPTWLYLSRFEGTRL